MSLMTAGMPPPMNFPLASFLLFFPFSTTISAEELSDDPPAESFRRFPGGSEMMSEDPGDPALAPTPIGARSGHTESKAPLDALNE